MSKQLFKEAIQAAREIEALSKSAGADTDAFVKLSEEQMDQMQALVERGQEALTQVASQGGFESVKEVRAALKEVSGEDFDALRGFAERNMPVNEITRTLAEVLAPGRVATLGALKSSPFGGAYKSAVSIKAEPAESGSSAAQAAPEEAQGSLRLAESEEKKASRAEAARALEEKTQREQSHSFQSLARAFGKGLPASKAGKPSIAMVPGTKVVEGAKQAADPVAELPAEAVAKKEAAEARAARAASGKKLTKREEFERAQMALFDAEAAPVPAEPEKKRGRGRPAGSKKM